MTGAEFKALRESKEVQARWVAWMSGVSIFDISRFENGADLPREKKAKIAAALAELPDMTWSEIQALKRDEKVAA